MSLYIVNDVVVAVTEVPYLLSDHEETGKRLLLHANTTLQGEITRLQFIVAWLERFIDAHSAVGHGWQVKDGQLDYKWMKNNPAPQYVLRSINCRFNKSGCKCTCSCLKGELPCTDYCQCVLELCANRPSHELVGSESGWHRQRWFWCRLYSK